jgi:peptidoglycan DL-endopeptidase CwlO
MTIELTGPAAVQSRILAIQARFAVAVPAAQTAGTATAGSASFASTLAALTSTTGATQGSGVTGDAVVQDARRYLGVPYVWGGTNPATGLDCSGLVQRVYGDLGIDLPRVAADQARQGTPVASLADARPGDLLAFGSPVDHIGIYAGNGQMIVAPKAGDVVKVEDVYTTPTAIRRVLPDSDAGPSGLNPLSGLGSATAGSALAAAPAAYRSLFEQAGQRYGVPATLLAAVARAESGFNPRAVSGAGAVGLMQLMPGTARGLGVDPRDPAQAVDGAARLLAGHLKTFGSTALALAAYNAGPGAVTRYGGIPPYAETQAYVQRVLAFQNGASA